MPVEDKNGILISKERSVEEVFASLHRIIDTVAAEIERVAGKANREHRIEACGFVSRVLFWPFPRLVVLLGCRHPSLQLAPLYGYPWTFIELYHTLMAFDLLNNACLTDRCDPYGITYFKALVFGLFGGLHMTERPHRVDGRSGCCSALG